MPHCQYAAVVYVTYDSRPKNTLAGSIKYPNFNGAPSSSNRVQFDLAQNDPFVAVPDGPMRGDFNPSVASDGSGFMVAWNRKEASFVSASNLWFVTSTLMARRYDEYGDALAPAVLLAQYGPHIFPKVENSSIGPLWSEAFAYTPANLASSVIWAGDRYRVTWAYASGELAAISLHGNGGSGALTIPPTLAGNHDRRNPPSVAYDPVHKRIMTTWHGPGNVIAGNLYSITNNTSTSFPNLLDGLSGIHPRIAWNQATRGWLLARDVTNPLGTVRVRALSADGVTSGAPPVVYSAVWPNNGSSTDYSNIGKTFVCPDPASAPVLALAFEELPGATYFADSSGYDNLGICIGGGCPLVGVPGVGTLGNSFVGDGKPPRSDRALQFDGINDNLTFSTQVGDNWAYSFWIKPEASAANTGSNWWEGSMILRNTAPGAVEREFGISMGAGNRILFGQGARSMASQPITLSQWHHVVASYRGTNFDGASVNFLFVDGVSQNATSGYPQPLDTVANMVLGAGSTGFKGSLDFLTLYKTFIDYEYPNNFVGQMYAGTAKDDLGYSENPSYCVLAAPSSSPSTGFPWSKLTIERNLARGAGPLLATDGLAVTVDPIAPTSTIKSLRNDQYVQAAGPGVTGTLLIAGDAFDTGAGVDHVDVLVNGVPTSATGSATWLYNIGLTEGRHSLQSVATDLVGWVETNPQTIYIIADGGPPVLSVLPQQLIPVRNRNGRWPVRLTGTLFDPPVGALTLFEGSGINPASIKVGVRNANGLELLSSPGVIGGDGWQAEVELPASMADPTGIFSVTVSAADNVGNIGTRTGTLRLDVPSVVAKLSAASRGRDYLSSQPALTNCCAVPATNAGNQASLSGTISSTMGLGALEGAFFSIEQTSALSDAVLILPLDNVNNREWFEDATLFQNAARCVSMDGGSECPLLSPNGRGGPAVYFDGGSTLLVSHDDSIDVGLMTDFSIQLWIKTSTPGRTLLSKRGGDPLRGYALQLNDDGRIVFESNGNASSAFGDPLTNNQWHHIAVVVARFPGGVGSGSAKMYIDGDYAGSAAVSDSFENSEALDIGGLSFLANQNFVGFIDHIVIVRRAWSAREVQLMRALPDVVWQPVSFVPALARTRATSPVAGTWTMPLPANLEHFYQLDLRGSDGTGRLFQLSNLWRGVIDNLPPRVTIVGTATGRTHLDPLTGAARYDIETTITARDQYLESTRFNAICNNTSQPVRGYIDEPWRTIAFPDFTLRDSLSYTCHSWATQANPVLSASACDQYGNCATASHSVSTAAVLQRANGTADPILIWPPAGSVVAMGQLITIQMAVANATPLKRIEVMVDGNPAEGVDFTQQQGLTRTIVTLDFHMPAAGENTYGLSVRTTGWDNVQTVGPVLNLTLDGAPPSGNLIETMITDAGAYNAASGLLRFTGGAGDSMGLGNIATVQVAVGDGPLVDAHWNGDGSWQTMAYVGANPYGKLIPLTMRSVDKAGRITTDTHPVFINIAPPPGFDATKIPTLTIENTSTDEASGVAIFVLRLSGRVK